VKYIYDTLLVYICNTRRSYGQSHVHEIHNHNSSNLDQKASHCMIQTGEARNDRNAIMNRYRALVDASSLDLLSMTLDAVPLYLAYVGLMTLRSSGLF